MIDQAPPYCYPQTDLTSLMAELRRQVGEHLKSGDLARASDIADFCLDLVAKEPPRV